MSRRDEVLAKVRTIPALPTAAARVIILLRDPDVDIKEVIRTIEYDPGLTSNVLRLANSAYFAGPRTISSLRDAIVRLGLNRVFQLVITSAIAPVARQAVKGYDLPPLQLLSHSVAVAVGVEELATRLKRPAPPATFTAGLLHDLGKIILGTFVEIDAAPILSLAYRERISFEVAENQVLGINHAEAGAALLERWNLPVTIVDVVRWHHEPESFTGETLAMDLVHAADHLSLGSGIGVGIDGLNYHPSPVVMSRLMLKADVAEAVLCHMIDAIKEIGALFEAPK
jgi:putative nucleotidyltransferase with HDIG domain